MGFYGDGDYPDSVAHGCRYFKYSGSLDSRSFATGEDVSCGMCRNWNGQKCGRNNFETLIKREY